MHLDIRVARSPADIETIRQLLREYQAELGVDLSFQHFSQEIAALPGAYAEPRGRLLCAEVEGAIVGCVAMRPLTGATCEMKRLFVAQSQRGSRVGFELVRSIIDHAKAAGYTRMLLDTLPSMGKAQQLYERFGFRDTEQYVANPVEGTRYMALDLGDSGSVQRPPS